MGNFLKRVISKLHALVMVSRDIKMIAIIIDSVADILMAENGVHGKKLAENKYVIDNTNTANTLRVAAKNLKEIGEKIKQAYDIIEEYDKL